MAQDEAQRILSMESNRITNLGTPTAANDATRTDNTTAPADPAAAAAAGASLLAAAQNHVHQGVHSVRSDAAANIYGDVHLVSGTGISLGQSGQDITVSTSGGAVNKVTLAEDRQASVSGTTEEIVAEFNINLDDAGGTSIQVRLSALVKAAAGTGTFRAYVGATSPGSTAGGTLRATVTTTNTAFEKQTNLGAGFTNPTGHQIVQITAVNSVAATKSTIRGYSLAIG
jgi:hypothetical protein